MLEYDLNQFEGNSADHAGDVLSVVSGPSTFRWASGTEVLDTLWRGRKKARQLSVSRLPTVTVKSWRVKTLRSLSKWKLPNVAS